MLDTAADPARLTAPRKDVLHELGDVLEGSVVISPGSCLEGLPADLADGYVLAIQRDTRQDVRSLVVAAVISSRRSRAMSRSCAQIDPRVAQGAALRAAP